MNAPDLLRLAALLERSGSSTELVSQRNALTVLGIPPRTFLATLRTPGFPLEIIRRGKLRMVDRVAFVAWLRMQSPAIDDGADIEELDEVDRLAISAGGRVGG